MKNATLGDRLIASGVMLVAAGITALLLWLVSMFVVLKVTSAEVVLSPYLAVVFTTFFVVIGFLFPAKAVDTLGVVWSKMESALRRYPSEK